MDVEEFTNLDLANNSENIVQNDIRSRLQRITDIISNNIRISRQEPGTQGQFYSPISIEDIILVELLTGGSIKIDSRSIASFEIYHSLKAVIENLDKMHNIILGSDTSNSINGCNLLLGDLVDVDLVRYNQDSQLDPIVYRTTLLRNIDFLVVPNYEKYRDGVDLVNGTVLQKLLRLNESEITSTIFKMRSFKTRIGGVESVTKICTVSDLITVTGGEDFVLLLSDKKAFMFSTYEDTDNFYLISDDVQNTAGVVQKLDNYAILSHYIDCSIE